MNLRFQLVSELWVDISYIARKADLQDCLMFVFHQLMSDLTSHSIWTWMDFLPVMIIKLIISSHYPVSLVSFSCFLETLTSFLHSLFFAFESVISIFLSVHWSQILQLRTLTES